MTYRPTQQELDELNALEIAEDRELATLDSQESARILSDYMDGVLTSKEAALAVASSPEVRHIVGRDIDAYIWFAASQP